MHERLARLILTARFLPLPPRHLGLDLTEHGGGLARKTEAIHGFSLFLCPKTALVGRSFGRSA
jgi:hypothetical protein